MFLDDAVLDVLSKIQNDKISNKDDLPLAFGANIPTMPLALSNLTTLSVPYENIFENSNFLGIHNILSILSVLSTFWFVNLLISVIASKCSCSNKYLLSK